MKNLIKIGSILFAFSFVSFVGCGDDELKPENFASQEDAQAALYDSEEEIFLALSELRSVADVAATFDGSRPDDFEFFKSNRSKTLGKKHSPHTFGYNTQTGYWTFDTTASDQGLSFFFNGKIRFTPRDAITGLPNETTNTMDYDVSASISETEGESFIELSYDADLVVTGIAAFRAATGNATFNGSNKVSFSLDVTLESDHIVFDYDHSYKIKSVVVDPTSSYPQSGSFEFTIKRDINASGFGSNFYVAGSITFDGTNIAVLEFGGYTFHIDLDGPYIVELD
ncbi:hypothetical protein F9K33_14775 [bacterium]|nr:MAG: hypothetical protein F9K33_14775 [bacterium]